MTMTISEALCRMAKLVQSKGESFEDVQAWDVIRSRLEVSDEMVDTVGKALYIHWSDVNQQAKDAYRKKIKAALVAALGMSMTLRDELERVMDLRYEIEQLLELSAKGEKHWEWKGTYEAAASSFFRDHGPALLEALDAQRAIEDHCVVTECVTWKDKEPYDAISAVIDWHVSVALDPAVSDVARDAERYRFLKEFHLQKWFLKTGEPSSVEFDFEGEGHDIDQAIDRARGGEE